MKTTEQKIREAKKSIEGLGIPPRHSEGTGMIAGLENSTVVGQLAAYDEYAAKILKKVEGSNE
jgi:hypothetical protein